jgi:hypothetical protein
MLPSQLGGTAKMNLQKEIALALGAFSFITAIANIAYGHTFYIILSFILALIFGITFFFHSYPFKLTQVLAILFTSTQVMGDPESYFFGMAIYLLALFLMYGHNIIDIDSPISLTAVELMTVLYFVVESHQSLLGAFMWALFLSFAVLLIYRIMWYRVKEKEEKIERCESLIDKLNEIAKSAITIAEHQTKEGKDGR